MSARQLLRRCRVFERPGGARVSAGATMKRLRPTLLPLLALSIAALPASAATARPQPGSAHGFEPRQLVVKFAGRRLPRVVALGRRAQVWQAAQALRRNPAVAYAEPNYVATASTSGEAPFDPDDSGTIEGPPVPGEAGRWAIKQWNFLAPEGPETAQLPTSPGGIDAPGAWRNLIAARRPGGTGVVVAVLDTGVAYRSFGSAFRRSPDFGGGQFLPGYDFVDHDRLPLDENGHGTHVAGTIAERTDNGIGLTGLAYGAKLMPVRVLDRNGRGNANQIAEGIRFAIDNDAQVINMSFNFGCHKRVPAVNEALREAYEAGVVTVASAGNLGSEGCVSAPATGPRVIGVGGTTEGGCLGAYSLAGKSVDVVAPGGGPPMSGCPSVLARPVYQVTLRPGSTKTFAIPSNYVGTSMAAAHVSAAAALVLASKTIGATALRGRVDAVGRRLRGTARSLGLPSTEQGAGLIDVARATERR
jgi:serine protease